MYEFTTLLLFFVLSILICERLFTKFKEYSLVLGAMLVFAIISSVVFIELRPPHYILHAIIWIGMCLLLFKSFSYIRIKDHIFLLLAAFLIFYFNYHHLIQFAELGPPNTNFDTLWGIGHIAHYKNNLPFFNSFSDVRALGIDYSYHFYPYFLLGR